MKLNHRLPAAARAALWASVATPLSFVAAPLLAVALSAVVIPAAIGRYSEDIHALYISVSVGGWAALAAAVAVGTALLFRLAVDRSRLPPAAAVGLAGALASAVAQWGLMSWTVGRFGYFDPDFVGSSWLLPLPMVACTMSAAAWLVTAGPARLLSAVGAVGAVVVLGVLAVESLAGAFDGLSESAWALAVTYLAVAAFIALLVGLAWEHRRSPAAGTAADG